MPNVHAKKTHRRGAVAVLAAVLIIVVLAMVAFTVDLGYIAFVCGQMQNAADSAAMAGAAKLLDQSLLKGTPNATNAMTNARSEAQKFCLKNYGGGVALTLDANSTNDPNGDIVCGYLANPSNQSQTMTFIPFPNAVQVHVHRDTVRNGSLTLFFANFLGMSSKDLDATATATYQAGVTGFKAQGDQFSCKLLPLAVYVVAWNSIVAGNGPDSFTVADPSTGVSPPSNVTSGADGIHEGKLFPLGNSGASGNFGMVDLGPPSNATGTYTNWINNGPSKADLNYFNSANGYPNGFQLDPTTGTLLLKGTPGLHAAMESALQGIIGQARIIPLYSTVVGNNNNAQYTIVGFAGCTVVEVSLQGSMTSKHITVQPNFVIDASAISSTISTPPLVVPTQQFVYQSASLCR